MLYSWGKKGRGEDAREKGIFRRIIKIFTYVRVNVKEVSTGLSFKMLAISIIKHLSVIKAYIMMMRRRISKALTFLEITLNCLLLF